MWAGPDVASTATRTSCPLFCWFLSWCGIFIISDWDFLVGWDLLLSCYRVLLYIIVVLLVIFGCWFLEWRSYCKMSAILRRNLELISRCVTCLLCCIWFDFGVVVLNFLLIFLGLSVIWAADIVLINSGIWRGIFAALKVVSVGDLNFVCVFFLLSAGVSFQSGIL